MAGRTNFVVDIVVCVSDNSNENCLRNIFIKAVEHNYLIADIYIVNCQALN